MSREKIIVALSGGVDSAVSAALLCDQGQYEVEGVFMKNWTPQDEQSLTDCPWEQDQQDAQAVCDKLQIPFRSINFEAQYKEKVVDYMLTEYRLGRTPNPDVMCNKEIKFRVFLDEMLKLGGVKIATGHYARYENGQLRRGLDPQKDQSYFLYHLERTQLEKSVFPIGHLPKAKVRQLAAEHDLLVSSKKDSQGICFIGHLNLKQFLGQYITPQKGELKLLPPDDGLATLEQRMAQAIWAGEHLGANICTIGEKVNKYLDHQSYYASRGKVDIKYVYIVAKDDQANHVYITDAHNDRHLYSNLLELENPVETGGETGRLEASTVINWAELARTGQLGCQIRYRQSPVRVQGVELLSSGHLQVELEGMGGWSVACGQSAVLYKGDQVLGGGVINKAIQV